VVAWVKDYVGRIGLKGADFGAHSLRAGFLTSAARRGASVFKMRDVSRHKSMDVLQAYVRDADLFGITRGQASSDINDPRGLASLRCKCNQRLNSRTTMTIISIVLSPPP
jgi:hypothetical protein